MDGWQRIGGVDWLCVEPILAPGQQLQAVEAGLILDHGYAHEQTADLGVGALAVVAVVRELRRPREIGGRVIEVQVATQVGLTETVIRLSGPPHAVRLGLQTLDHILSDPFWLDLSDLPSPPEFGWDGWGTELAAWFGMGSGPFAATDGQPWTDDPRQLHHLLAALHPSRGSRTIGWTTDPGLPGSAFAGLGPTAPATPTSPDPTDFAPGTAAPERTTLLRWREPAPTADGPRSIEPSYRNNLLSLCVPAQRVDEIAVRLLARTIDRSLVGFHRLIQGLDLTSTQIDGRQLVAIRAVASDQGYDAELVARALAEALAAYDGLADSTLADEIDRARSTEALNIDFAPFGRALDAFRSRSFPDRDDLVAVVDRLSVDQLRAAVGRVRAGLLVGVAAVEAARRSGRSGGRRPYPRRQTPSCGARPGSSSTSGATTRSGCVWRPARMWWRSAHRLREVTGNGVPCPSATLSTSPTCASGSTTPTPSASSSTARAAGSV